MLLSRQRQIDVDFFKLVWVISNLRGLEINKKKSVNAQLVHKLISD